MYLTGFTDEVDTNIDVQIAVTKELGWHNIEMRSMFGAKNLGSISDAEFDELYGKLSDAGIKINSFGSGIGNWAKPILEPPDSSYEEFRNAAPRLHKLGTKMIRIMSFVLPPELRPHSWEYEEEVIKRVSTLAKMAEDEGLLLVHENCNNWGGLSYEHTLRIMERVKSPALRLVFDTGNPVFDDDVRGEPPYKKQSSWEFYRNVRPFIEYVHIKDGYMQDGEMHFTFAGEGNGDTVRIFADLYKTGYDGGFSIEPHMGSVFHDASVKTPEQFRHDVYVEYGKRVEKMLATAGYAVTRD